MKKKGMFKILFVLALVLFVGVTASSAEPWKFGVMSDTQWPNSPDNKNPNVAVNVIRHLNQEFIDKDVKFVIQVGDLTDTGGTNSINLDVRATFAQDLYNAGIGFYPLRGNHESSASNAVRFQQIFPQTQTGLNNQTPNMVSTTIYGPQVNTNGTFLVGASFVSQPTMEGLTYSFDYNNARFVLIDQFTKPGGTSHSTLNQADVDWVGSQFSGRPLYTHAFSFAHKGLITENHNDNLFGSNPTVNQAAKDLMEAFMMHLHDNGVRYHMGGHDHMHNRAIVSSPNTGNYKVQNIIAASNSYKFYIPPSMSAFNTQTWRALETQIAQEIFTVGYYIFTVDGPKVTVDYYAMPNGCNGDCDLTYDVIPYEGNTPTSNGLFTDPVPFAKHETFGYSLNGIEKLVPQGAGYVLTDDTSKAVSNGETGYLGTTAKILSGTNGSTGKDYNNRALTKSVNTGWAPKAGDTLSDVLTLWGMTDSLATNFTDSGNPSYNYRYVVPDTTRTDTFALSMTYDPSVVVSNDTINQGKLVFLATRDGNGNWVKAASRKFVLGRHNAKYPLGTYGVDPATYTAWAVTNATGDFAVIQTQTP